MPVITFKHKVEEIISKCPQFEGYEEFGPELSIREIVYRHYLYHFEADEASSVTEMYFNKLLEGL